MSGRLTTAICMCGATWTYRNSGRLAGRTLRMESCPVCDPSTIANSRHENDGFGWCANCGHAWPCTDVAAVGEQTPSPGADDG